MCYHVKASVRVARFAAAAALYALTLSLSLSLCSLACSFAEADALTEAGADDALPKPCCAFPCATGHTRRERPSLRCALCISASISPASTSYAKRVSSRHASLPCLSLLPLLLTLACSSAVRLLSPCYAAVASSCLDAACVYLSCSPFTTATVVCGSRASLSHASLRTLHAGIRQNKRDKRRRQGPVA